MTRDGLSDYEAERYIKGTAYLAAKELEYLVMQGKSASDVEQFIEDRFNAEFLSYKHGRLRKALRQLLHAVEGHQNDFLTDCACAKARFELGEPRGL